jgi:homoserine kinase type II
MAVKTPFSAADFETILAQYAVGDYLQAEPIPQGTVQTNYFFHTSQGKFVFRVYENRSFESALFESHLLAYLKKQAYPCPRPIRDRHGKTVGLVHDKPFMIFEYIAGQPVDQPGETHKRQLIQKAAQLQNLTRKYRPRYKKFRWNYDVDLCRVLARGEAEKIGTQDAFDKLAWVERQLATLQLPRAMPKGICHCDFHFSNVLFEDGQFAALLDFDDANYTFLLFDLVGLIEAWGWNFPAETLDMEQAHWVVQEYMKHRRLNALEKRHLFDVYQLSILFDCIWFFRRGRADDFYEKTKIESLRRLGRKVFYDELFSAR